MYNIYVLFVVLILEFSCLFSGPLLKDIVTHMNEKKHGSLNPNRKLWIYSGHDTTIYSLLNTMGINNNLLVPYAAVLMIELRLNNTGNYVVTVSFVISINI
jgi:hypothetical protein